MNMEGQVVQVNLDDIIPNRFQPRIAFDEKALNELAASIKEHGIIQPLVLRKLGKKYEIIAGERRYKAATLAGLQTVPAVISNIDDNKSAEVALVENIQRKDLTPIEEARSYKNLLDKGYLTQEQLAKKMGLSQSSISNKLRLLNLDNSVQQALLDGKISERHARSLLSITDTEEQKKWLNKIVKERLTVKQLDEALKKNAADNADEGDVPLVKSTPNIEEIKEQATDINNNKPKNIANLLVSEDTMTEYSENLPNQNNDNENTMVPPAESLNPNPAPMPAENINPNPAPSPAAPLNEAPQAASNVSPFNDIVNGSTPAPQQEVLNVVPQTSNKFFNQLEDEPAALDNLNPFAPTANFSVDNSAPANSEVEIFDAQPAPTNTPASMPEETNNNQQIDNTNQASTMDELNPNNKFFQPIQEAPTESLDTMDSNENTSVNPMDYVDNLSSPQKASDQSSNSLVDAINETRKFVNSLNSKGLAVKIDEADLDNFYQINISIMK